MFLLFLVIHFLNLFNSHLFDNRNYSLAIVFTALDPVYKCEPCKYFDKQMRSVAKSVMFEESNPLYFASLNFEEGKESFKKMGLNTAPVLFLYSIGQSEPIKYDLTEGVEAQNIIDFLNREGKYNLSYRPPINYGKIFAIMGSLLVSLVGFIIVMCSGYMWNQIRHAPYMARVGDRFSLIAPGFQNQCVMESQVITVALIGIVIVLLTSVVPKINAGTQNFVTSLLLGIWFLSYGYLTSLFAEKSGGYPYTIL
ncbi:Magnesium transporter protein 1 domain-containing protein [Rozella allomycis CSF55]|uniref:Magnesium transporter protein 1 domain-containing protein n=1 Tax=Rozella allomycis (strain CSF55) TaxID=988480 RepID=A0A075B2C3_ROZAC|nr:Magnesium transporter protein 1 domain-containing protein [Rozella allomycis CSF55]|eukprot:EPZ36522.1 Magnesium transporter protein 1 domain-containing protein [Rozella allomycis CSF55]